MKSRSIKLFISMLMILLSGCATDKTPLAPDAWQRADPAAYGLDAGTLQRGFIKGEQLGYLHALLVWRKDRLVAERYYNGFSSHDAHNIHSVSKSLLSALVGIARSKELLSLDEKALPFFPEYANRIADDRIKDITLEHLLTMTAGFPGDHERYLEIAASANWLENTFALPLLYAPGERFNYFTFSSHILSAILSKVAGMSTLDFANLNLFNPAGMQCLGWNRDPQGYYFGGNDMFFRPRDLLKFAQLCYQGGAWNGAQIIPAAWIEEAWRMRLGGSKDWASLKKYGYGYHWWMGQLQGHDAKLAIGHGGQFIVILKDLQMIIVSASKPPYEGNFWDIANAQEEAVLTLIADYVVGAVRE